MGCVICEVRSQPQSAEEVCALAVGHVAHAQSQSRSQPQRRSEQSGLAGERRVTNADAGAVGAGVVLCLRAWLVYGG